MNKPYNSGTNALRAQRLNVIIAMPLLRRKPILTNHGNSATLIKFIELDFFKFEPNCHFFIDVNLKYPLQLTTHVNCPIVKNFTPANYIKWNVFQSLQAIAFYSQ